MITNRTVVISLALWFTAATACFATEEPTPGSDAAATNEESATVESAPAADEKKAESPKPAATKAETPKAATTAKSAAPKAGGMMKASPTPMGKAKPPMPAANPHMGTWKLDESKSKMDPGMGKNTVVTYVAAGDKVKMTIEGTNREGKPTKTVWMGKFDGKVYPAKGNGAFDAMSIKMANDRTNDLTAMKGGKVFMTGKVTVAKDGKTRVVTAKGTGPDGKKFKSKSFYTKQ